MENSLQFLLPYFFRYVLFSFIVIKNQMNIILMDISPPRQKNVLPQDQNSQQDSNFSSFDSDGNHQISSSTIDDKGFKTMHHYKQKQMSFAQTPAQLGRLYQIYLNNVERKARLKKQIQQMIAKQLTALRISYDKESYALQQFYDPEEESKEYQISKQNYEKRQQDLQRLKREYKQLKVLQLQYTMMMKPLLKETLERYASKYKQILSVQIFSNTIYVLSKQKIRHRRLAKIKGKNFRYKKINQSKSEESREEQMSSMTLEKQKSANSQSRNASEDEESNQEKTITRYLLRKLKFLKSKDSNDVSFQPLQNSIDAPAGKQYIGILLLDGNHQIFLLLEEKKIYLSQKSKEGLKITQQVNIDKPIKFYQVSSKKLYIVTDDNILRIFQIKQKQLNLIKIIYCNFGDFEEMTHFSVINESENVIFVHSSRFIFELNTSTYSYFKLSEVPSPITRLNTYFIETKNQLFWSYYSQAGGHGKIVLKDNQKLKEAINNKKHIQVDLFEKNYYLVEWLNSGQFKVLVINQLLSN